MWGGCAAVAGWVFGRLAAPDDPVAQAGVRGLWLGLFVACGLSLVDALWSFSVKQVFSLAARVAVAVAVGCVGGFVGAAVGQLFLGWTDLWAFYVLGWTITGLLVGVSVGAFDLLSQFLSRRDTRGARRKVRNGMIGGTVGGLMGGILSLLLNKVFPDQTTGQWWSPSFTGFVILGMCIGLLIGLAQVILKEAWVRVEAGFRPGRQIILSKAETTIGRGESCDIGLFGDATIERLHARIVQEGNRYLLADADTPGGTYLNGDAVSEPTPLHSGDTIQVGKSVLRFSERHQRAGQ